MPLITRKKSRFVALYKESRFKDELGTTFINHYSICVSKVIRIILINNLNTYFEHIN